MNTLIFSVVTVALFAGFAAAQSNYVVSPLTPVGDNKTYYVQTFFKSNFFQALRFCRYNGMELATLPTDVEVLRVSKYLIAAGLQNERFWTSGNDLDEEGKYVWFGNGRPFLSATVWNAGEPNSQSAAEDCVEIRLKDTTMKLNDIGCTDSIYSICEVVTDVNS